jgi:uncharacterized protein YecE (DUF72 family)
MLVVACSGFPGPVSRYWGELPGVEIAESENAPPGAGTVRRWLREAPKGFAFSLLAPKAIAAGGFAQKGKAAPLLAETAEVAKALGAQALVFVAPPEWLPTRAAKAAVKAFAEALPRGLPTCVFDLQGWSPEETAAAVGGAGALAAQNPLRAPLPAKQDLLYVRLPGPAGHRSRYEEASLEQVAAAVRGANAKRTFVVLANIDMLPNAKSLVKLLG